MFWARWLEKRATKAALALRNECVQAMVASAPSYYRRLDHFKYSYELFDHGPWPWQKRYRIVLLIGLTKEEDRGRVTSMVTKWVTDYLSLPGKEKIWARIFVDLVSN